MPVCRCDIAGCARLGGREVDPRTAKEHRRQDERRLQMILQEQSRGSVDDEREMITQYLASLTLSDELNSSSTRQTPGGRLWAGSAPSQTDLGPIAAVPSHHESAGQHQSAHPSRSQRLLQRLSAIDDMVNAFGHDVTSLIADLNSADISEDFSKRVEDLLGQISSLEVDLSRVALVQKLPIPELHRSIKEKLDGYYASITAAGTARQSRVKDHVEHLMRTTASYSSGQILALSCFPDRSNLRVDHHFNPIFPNTSPILQVCYFLVVACHVVLHVGRRGCNFILSTLTYMLQLAFLHSKTALGAREQKLLSDLAADVRTPAQKFHLDGQNTIYAVCPNAECHQTYKPSFDEHSQIPRYPLRCTRSLRTGHCCGEMLTRPKHVLDSIIQAPIKTFVYFDFKDWMANILSRSGFEDMMDSAWDKCFQNGHSECISDIFEGDVLKNFKGPDGNHFGAATGNGSYVFSLNVDFFNPFGSGGSHKSISCGIISMICLNLPPDIRYKPENMFLAGIVPGPKEPPLDCINPYLRPLVDDLVGFWDPGVHYSRTFKFPQGRKVHCAIVALVCDLPAARKTAGLSAHSHNFFCSVCYCTKAIHGYKNTEYHSWRRRTDTEYRVQAAKWKAAKDEKEAQDIFDEKGVRCSELIRLPYFDFVLYVVIDGMHNLFLGLIKLHFEGILGLRERKSKKKKKGNQIEEQPERGITVCLSEKWKNFSVKEQVSVEKLHQYLEGPMTAELQVDRGIWVARLVPLHKRSLHFVCAELGLTPPDLPENVRQFAKTRKFHFVNILLDWVGPFSCTNEPVYV